MIKESIYEKIGRIIGLIFVISVLLFAGAYCIKELWNFLVPEVFNGPKLTYGQAFAGFCLIKSIFPFNINFKNN